MAKIEEFPRRNDSRASNANGEKQRSEQKSTSEAAVEALDTVTTRRSAQEIYSKVERNARDELQRSTRALAFSGIAGGLTMGLTGLGVAVAQAELGPGKVQEFVSLLFYPLGFIAVIIGRAQLFTENTLYPVALILTERKLEHVWNTLRLWTVVFACNILGAALFAALAIKTPSLHSEVANHLVQLGVRAAEGSFWPIFWSGVIGGWIIALMAWIVSASHWTIGQVVIVWVLTSVVGLGHFAHCIASTGEILSSVFAGHLPASRYAYWIAAATLGNIVGGVFFVTVLNFGQISDDKESDSQEQED